MKKVGRLSRWLIGTGGLFVLVVAVVLWNGSEPEFEGKSVSYWMFYPSSFPIPGENPLPDPKKFQQAFASMGTRAVPAILANLRRYDSRKQRIYAYIHARLPRTVSKRLSTPLSQNWASIAGVRKASLAALCEIGPDLDSWLERMLSDQSINVRMVGAQLLDEFPEHSATVFPLLAAALKDDDYRVRLQGVHALTRMGEMAVPLLIRALDDDYRPQAGKPEFIRLEAMGNLAMLGTKASRATSKLRSLLDHTNEFTRIEAAITLLRIDANLESLPLLVRELDRVFTSGPGNGEAMISRIMETLEIVGPKAKEAVPVLVRIYEAYDPSARILNVPGHPKYYRDDRFGLRAKSVNALRAIDPDAAIKAGVE